MSLGTLSVWRALLLLLLLAAPALAAELSFPQLTGRVVDEAGILSASTRNGLTEMLARHERATGEQVVVVTLKSLQGYSIEDFGYQLGRHWGIGQKDKNTGTLLIVAPNEHKVRIEVGYGLEGKLTDAASRIIIERDIVPAFRRGNYNAGMIVGVTSILTVLGDAAGPQSGIRRSANRGLNVRDPMLWRAVLFMGIWGLIFFLMFSTTGPDDRHGRKKYAFFRPGRSSGGFWGGGGSFGGGGGFSGGGGSFGGGGASGGW